jgi:hypothetical protein
MANSYNWTIDSMVSYPQIDGLVDVVVTVNWTCRGTDGTYSGLLAGVTSLTLDPNGTYVPYADLTETLVSGWVQSALGIEGVNSVQSVINGQIATAANVPTILPNPWG